MEFRRINGLPPYVFAAINQLRDEGRLPARTSSTWLWQP